MVRSRGFNEARVRCLRGRAAARHRLDVGGGFREVREAAQAHPAAGLLLDWGFSFLSIWLIGGLFLDGWAHAHDRVDDVFLTPWHAVLYSGALAIVLLLATTYAYGMTRGYAWPRVLPDGYGLSLIGAARVFHEQRAHHNHERAQGDANTLSGALASPDMAEAQQKTFAGSGERIKVMSCHGRLPLSAADHPRSTPSGVRSETPARSAAG